MDWGPLGLAHLIPYNYSLNESTSGNLIKFQLLHQGFCSVLMTCGVNVWVGLWCECLGRFVV